MKEIPPRRFLITGKTNAGKTLFMLSFAEYMGYENLTIAFKSLSDGSIKSDDVSELKRSMVGSGSHTTRCIQAVDINMPVFKGKKPVNFIDTTGLSSTIHFNPSVREGMVQTLSYILREDCIILHVIDAANAGSEGRVDDIDMEVYRIGKRRGSYMVLSNKSDLNGFDKGQQIIEEALKDVRIIKISALDKKGFDEVKKYVSRLA